MKGAIQIKLLLSFSFPNLSYTNAYNLLDKRFENLAIIVVVCILGHLSPQYCLCVCVP
uniref:Uncharacterized protein n=1 Tax=Anguilla anguilla TaxID=7936 RepID=A0A0E9TGM3_ANGAN